MSKPSGTKNKNPREVLRLKKKNKKNHLTLRTTSISKNTYQFSDKRTSELVIMAGKEINEDYPAKLHDYLSTFENSSGLLKKLEPLKQAKVVLISAYTLNSMFWVYLAIQGVNPKEHPVKQELGRNTRVYMYRVKEITDKKKAGKLDRGATSRFVKNALWEPKPKHASKVANKEKSKN
uniref:Nuclear nucleic acid-binding protein C1D n=1 Tax=Rhinolophus ferrumequinum TaxID=59479 RepID=A0A671E016_RHIFE